MQFEAGVKAVQDGDDEAFWRSLLPTAAEAYEKSLWQQWEKPKEKRRAAQNKTYADLAEEEDASSEEMIVEEEPAEQPQKRGPGRPKGRKQVGNGDAQGRGTLKRHAVTSGFRDLPHFASILIGHPIVLRID